MNELIEGLGNYSYLGSCLKVTKEVTETQYTKTCGLRVVASDPPKMTLLKMIAALKCLEVAGDADELLIAKQAATELKADFGENWQLVIDAGRKRLAELKQEKLEKSK